MTMSSCEITYDLKNWSGPSLLQGALRLYLSPRVSGVNAVILLFLGSFLSCFCFALRYQSYTTPLPDWPTRQKQNHLYSISLLCQLDAYVEFAFLSLDSWCAHSHIHARVHINTHIHIFSIHEHPTHKWFKSWLAQVQTSRKFIALS